MTEPPEAGSPAHAARPGVFAVTLFVAQILSMSAVSTVPALLPQFQSLWDLSATEGGWLAGVLFVGVAVFTPLLTALTDRVDTRCIVLASMVVCIVSSLGYGLFADGFWSATLWRLLQGIGFAGTYMPGLRAIAESVPGVHRNRAVALFTATFPLGHSFSFLATGLILDPATVLIPAESLGWDWGWGWGWTNGDWAGWDWDGWRLRLAALAVFPAVGIVLAARILRPHRPVSATGERRSILPALPDRQTLPYMLVYFIHNGEGSAIRGFAVALLLFCGDIETSPLAAAVAPALILAIGSIAGFPGVMLVEEIARRVNRRFDRRRMQIAMLLIATGMSVATAAAAGGPYLGIAVLLFAYWAVMSGDAGLINTGILDAAAPERRGAVMATHAMCGFAGGFLVPVLFGLTLDLGGGQETRGGWLLALALMAAANLVCAGVYALTTHRQGARAPK